MTNCCDEQAQKHVIWCFEEAIKLLHNTYTNTTFHCLYYGETLRKIKAVKHLLSSIEAIFPS